MNKKVVITGGSSGLGAAILQRMKADRDFVIDWSREKAIDVSVRSSVLAAAQNLLFDKIDVLINCAGINGLNYLEHLKEDEFDKIMATNAKAIFLVTQALADKLRGGTVLNIVSNAAHLPMTASLAYNGSKAAAWAMTRQLARELGKTHKITVFSVSPNKLAGTKMSKVIDQRVCELRGWTPEQARKYQLAALPAEEETDPDTLAEFIVFLLSTKQRHKFLQGCDITYGAP
jgi:NAD(P)-dependent dehydrogenase (short-subunit alcohol dehydrogenase family)